MRSAPVSRCSVQVQVDPSGCYLATSGSDRSISILDYETGETVVTLFGHSGKPLASDLIWIMGKEIIITIILLKILLIAQPQLPVGPGRPSLLLMSCLGFHRDRHQYEVHPGLPVPGHRVWGQVSCPLCPMCTPAVGVLRLCVFLTLGVLPAVCSCGAWTPR